MTADTQRADAGGVDPKPRNQTVENADFISEQKNESKVAGQREIKRRYANKWPTQSKPDRIKSVRRKQVLQLLHDRYGAATLPDDAGGSAALQLPFELDLAGPTSQKIAPWADGATIERLIDAANKNSTAWSLEEGKTIAERLGERLEVTFDEFKRLGLTHIRPCDAQRHEVNEYRRGRKAARDLEAQRRRRSLAKQARSPATPPHPWDLRDDRQKALACVPLADREWRTMRQLAEYASERLGAFSGLDYPAAHQAVLRAVKKLEALGVIETKTETGSTGLKVLSARRPFTAAEIEAEHNELMREVAAEQGEESDAGV